MEDFEEKKFDKKFDPNKSPRDFGCIPEIWYLTKEFLDYCKQVAIYLINLLKNDEKKRWDNKETDKTVSD